MLRRTALLSLVAGIALAAGFATGAAASAEARDPAGSGAALTGSGEGKTARGCFLGLLEDPGQPRHPRIALYRRGGPGECDALILDTGYPLSAVERGRDRKALRRGRGRLSCGIRRDGPDPQDWERALTRMLSPGLRGEALLHLGRVEEALAAFQEGLPDPLSLAWLKEAARNVPARMAKLLPRSLASRNLRTSGSALEVLGDLISSHPADALEPLRRAFHRHRRALWPRILLLGGEEAAGLRAARPDSPEADWLTARIERELSGRNAAARAAAGEALPLAEPDPRRAVELLARAGREETDAASRTLLLAALRDAGGIGELFDLTHAASPELRRAALWTVAGVSSPPAGEADPLLRLLREEGADPGEVVRRLAGRRGPLPSEWGPELRRILPDLGDEDRARVPGLLCALRPPPEGSEEKDGPTVLLDMVRGETSPRAGAAAVEALGSCGGERREAALSVLLATAKDASRDAAVRSGALRAAALLARTPRQRDRLLAFLGASLDAPDGILLEAAADGLVLLGREEASRPAALLAGAALRTPPDAASRAAEAALARMFRTAPGPVTAALRDLGRRLPEEDRGRAFELFQSLKPEKRDRILARWRAALAAPGARVGPELQVEMSSLAGYWPREILNLVEPAFQASRGEERLRLLDLMVDLARHLPDRVLSLLTLPVGSSPRLAEATREAKAAALAWKILADPARGPGDLYDMALDPLDSRRRDTGRLSLWLMALESDSRRVALVAWARSTRAGAALPLRVELGRWLAEVSEMGPRKIPAPRGSEREREVPPGPRRARFLPGTSGGSAPAPSAHPR